MRPGWGIFGRRVLVAVARTNVVESDFRDWATAGVSWRVTFRASLGGVCHEDRLPKTGRLRESRGE